MAEQTPDAPPDEQQKIADQTLLDAVDKVNYDRINLCLQKGANINTRNGDGRTPLMLAVWKDHPGLVRFVLSKMPDLFAKDNGGKTAYDLIKNVNSDSVRNEITDVMLRALPDRSYIKAVMPDHPEAANANNGDDTPVQTETQGDISVSKPVTILPRQQGKGFRL